MGTRLVPIYEVSVLTINTRHVITIENRITAASCIPPRVLPRGFKSVASTEQTCEENNINNGCLGKVRQGPPQAHKNVTILRLRIGEEPRKFFTQQVEDKKEMRSKETERETN